MQTFSDVLWSFTRTHVIANFAQKVSKYHYYLSVM